jgi:hypothetical protein
MKYLVFALVPLFALVLLSSCKKDLPKTDCGRLHARIKSCRKAIKKSKSEISRWVRPEFMYGCKRWFKMDAPLARLSNKGLVKCLESPSCGAYARCLAAVMERRQEGPGRLREMLRSARSYFREKKKRDRDGKTEVPRFPSSAPLTPSKLCCKHKGGKCRDASWNHPSWKALDFDVNRSHHFQYQFFSCGVGSKAHGIARAVAQPECDGRYLVFEQRITVDEKLTPKTGEFTPGNFKIYWTDKLPKDQCSPEHAKVDQKDLQILKEAHEKEDREEMRRLRKKIQ